MVIVFVLSGNVNTTVQKKDGETLGTLPIANRTGNVLTGWFTTPISGGAQVSATTTVSGNATYYARWQAVNVTYPVNNQTYVMGNMNVTWTAISGATYDITLRNLTTDKPVFENRSVSGTSYIIAQSDFIAGNRYRVALRARLNNSEGWCNIEFTMQAIPKVTVTFDARGGSVTPTSVTFDTGGTINGALGQLPTPTRAGYTFDGWWDTTGGAQIAGNQFFNASATIYARWNISAELTLNTSYWDLTSSAQNMTVTVSSNVPWSVSSNSAWLTVSPASGSNNGSFTISATANDNTSFARTDTVTVSGGGISRTISVTQAAATAVTVTFNSGGASGTIPNPITVNVGQTIIIPGPGNLAKSDAFFNGWKVNGTNTVYHQGNKPAFSTNTGLVAQWIRLEGGERF